MPTLNIQGTELPYEEKDIVTFDEGLIGLPHLQRMVVVSQPDIEPFLWLASLDEEGVALVIAEASGIFPDYAPAVPADCSFSEALAEDEHPMSFAIVLLAAEWEKATANLRAPIFVSTRTRRGAQVILPDHTYSVGQPLPLAAMAV